MDRVVPESRFSFVRVVDLLRARVEPLIRDRSVKPSMVPVTSNALALETTKEAPLRSKVPENAPA
jgi:hypothetical protein